MPGECALHELVTEGILLSLQNMNKKPWNYLGAKIKGGSSSENVPEFAFSEKNFKKQEAHEIGEEWQRAELEEIRPKRVPRRVSQEPY